MANIFANVLTFLAGMVNNSVSTFSLFGNWSEEECPKEML